MSRIFIDFATAQVIQFSSYSSILVAFLFMSKIDDSLTFVILLGDKFEDFLTQLQLKFKIEFQAEINWIFLSFLDS